MMESKSIVEKLIEFNNIIDDLKNIEVKLDYSDKALLLLCSLPRSFEYFKDALFTVRKVNDSGGYLTTLREQK